MKPSDLTPETLLDQAIAAARDEPVDAAVARAAADRVWERLAREAVPQPAAVQVARIGSCADYQALIPAYLAGELSPARALLVEDHTRECVPCRKAMKGLRGGGARTAERRGAAPTGAFSWRRLALAASVVLAVGLASGLAWLGPFGARGEIAQVRTVEGQLFRVEVGEAAALRPGDPVAAGERIRTGRDSGAVVRLADGTAIELRERSEISVAERGGETTIRIDRGSVIVQAAKQHGHLYAATDDCLVAVTGTIFAINHGTKGSRVSVIEGEVRVEQGRSEQVLRPGEQAVTQTGLAPVAIEQEISWSRDRERYVALLAELKALNEELGRTLARSGLRYESRLLGLVPADTAVYVAMPNVSAELGEMHRVLEERLGQSEILAQFWRERIGASGLDRELAEVVRRISALGEHLGEEIAVALPLEDGEPGSPLVLAEVRDPAAFAAVLAAEVERINSTPGGPRLVLITDPATAPAAGSGEILLWSAGDLFAASPEVTLLAELAHLLARPGSGPFVSTPFHARLAEAYSQGAQWLLGADLGAVVRGNAAEEPQALAFTGFDRVEHLIVERKENGEVAHTGAVVSFAGPRSGVASWLAAPGPMGGLDFVSPEAQLAAAFVVEDPASIVDQILGFLAATDPGFLAELARFESQHGVNIRNDLAAPLGGELVVALDGPALPTPSWKVVAEVYDPARLQQAIEWAVAEAARAAAAAGGEPPLTLASEQIGARTSYRLSSARHPFEVRYTFEAGFFVAAPTRPLLERALQVRDSGYGLADSPEFVALLPEDGFLDFSAVVWSHLGPLGDAFLGAVSGSMSDEQRQAIEELDLDAPTLTCAYGESDRIRIVSTGRGGLLGSRLGSILGLGALAGAAH